ncbi:hypothetical protein AVEN_40701-1 [Araneus ventricosus]|uniref:Uncharacterized protein n=1 Tax=Araneus ventricosus TaxID=182803 RepID=A0A4Y2RHL2_ARAVE|nr:hypothetical protein AVEN_40701-1 [Araneus ventricosus]
MGIHRGLSNLSCGVSEKRRSDNRCGGIHVIRQMLQENTVCYKNEGNVQQARLAQSVEHETLNLGVVGSSPTLGGFLFCITPSVLLASIGTTYVSACALSALV